MTVWIIVVAAGCTAFAFRFSFIALLGRIELPGWLERPLELLAPAVLAALVAPAVVAPSAVDEATAPRVIAAVLAGLVAWRSRSVGLTVVLGLPLLWILESLI